MLARRIFKWLAVSLAVLVIITLSLIGPIDRTPLQEQPFFLEMMAKLDTVSPSNFGSGKIRAGWAKVNITPSKSTPMAGYQQRDHFDSVHDSLYARMVLLQVKNQTVALLNVDLLLFPPALKIRLDEKLKEADSQVFLYVSATHTHNGIGGWDNSIAGEFALGDYNPEWVEATADTIVNAILSQVLLSASIRYWESDASELVVNRIAYDKGEKDGKLRGLIVERNDSTKACLFTFSAHATSITKTSYELSVDYPGKVISELEKEFDFGMFMAGMVGSHAYNFLPERRFALVEKEGALLFEKFPLRVEEEQTDSLSISAAHIPIEFGPSQLRISKNWKARNWVLASLFGKLQGELTYLQLGDLVMIGTPCDFSGEIFVRDSLESLAAKRGKHLVITSFNGNYTGYVTYDGHYDSINNAETRVMNWLGPYYGEYYSAMIRKLLSK